MGKSAKENPAVAARHCLEDLPYRMVVFSRFDGNKVPLYLVAGSKDEARGADKALRTAHKIHGGPCFYCRKDLKYDEITIDHIEAIQRGGGASIQNLVISCKPCNAKKGHEAIEAYKPEAGREWLAALLKQVQDRLNRMS